jgi:hypothetical protein
MSHHYSGPALGFPHGDARLDLTDLYAFGKPGDDRKSILIMNVHPSFSLEPRGPTRCRQSPLKHVNSLVKVIINLHICLSSLVQEATSRDAMLQ